MAALVRKQMTLGYSDRKKAWLSMACGSVIMGR